MSKKSSQDSASERATIRAPGRLHGRLREVRPLWEAFHRAQRGEMILVLVEGPAGMGKTRLVESLLDPMRIEGGRIARGCWVRQQTGPFEGLLDALDAAVSDLLSEPELERAELRGRLERELGDGLGLFTGLLPELELITGARPPPPAMAPQEARHRFQQLVMRLVRCFASAAGPLVLFLDDLQWADPSSLDLVRRLMEAYRGPGVLLVSAIRLDCERPCIELSDVLEVLEPVRSRLVRVPLGPLDAADVDAMVAELLECPVERSRPLSTLAYETSGGNPWLVQRFLVKLHTFGSLRRDREGWHWSLDEARELAPVEGEQLVVGAALDDLPESTREALELAACLGPEQDAELLELACNASGDALWRLLEPAMHRGLLAGVDGGGHEPEEEAPRRWRFAHHRLHQALYASLGTERRRKLHRRVVRRLRKAWKARPRARVLFALADQLQLLPSEGEPTKTRQARVGLLLEAGQRALAGAAWETAARHLEAAESVLDASISPATTLELYAALALALQAAGRFDDADIRLERAMSLVGTAEQCADLAVQRTGMLVHATRYGEALKEGLCALRDLGGEIPEAEDSAAWQALTELEAARQPELMRGRTPMQLAGAPPMPAGLAATELKILGALAPPAYVYPAVLPWVVARMVNLCLEHGNGELAPLAYVFQGFLCCASGRYGLGQDFGRLALELERRRSDRSLYAPVVHLYVNFVNHWTRPLDTGLELGLRAVNQSMQHGLFDYAGWLAMNGALGIFYRGLPLDGSVDRVSELCRLTRDDLRYQDASTVTAAVLLVGSGLSGSRHAAPEAGVREVDLWELAGTLDHYQVARAHVHLLGMMRCVFMGDWVEARRHADALRPDLPQAAGMYAQVEFSLFEVVLLAAEHPVPSMQDRAMVLEGMRRHVGQLETWASASPENHGAKLSLAKAELAAFEGAEDAVSSFVQAYEGFAARGFLHLEALAAERLAAHLRAVARPQAAGLFLDAARAAYRRWGAKAKLAQLGRALDERAPAAEGEAREPTRRVHEEGRAARSLSEGLEPDRLARRLAEIVVNRSGARRGAFFHGLDGELTLVVAAGAALASDRWPLPLDRCAGWPRERIQEAFAQQRATGSSGLGVARAIAGPEPTDGEPATWLCLPIGSVPGPVGALYLEHEVRPGAFDGIERQTLEVLGDLALTALADLRGYEDLARISRALEQSSLKLARHSESLEAEVREWAGDLEALHQEHHSTLEALLDGVVRVDLQGRILYANPAAARITGFSSEELVGALGTELLQPRDPQGAALSADRPRRPLAQQTDAPFHAVLKRKGGTRVSVEFRWSPVFRPDGSIEGGVIAIRDTSKRQALEDQLRHAQKMEAMGRFAGGMAHDLNNLLVPILGHLERIRTSERSDPDLQRRVDAAEKAAQRAAALVKQALAFSRRAEIFERPNDLVPIVDDVCRFLRRSMDRAIQLRWKPPRGDYWFRGDAGLMQQVLLNLGLNARDAIESARSEGALPQPHIEISLSRTDGRWTERQAPRGMSDPCLILEVRDNGVGMDPETQARIFEPFFTTKAPDKGTGLGLAVVYGIVEQHGGRVMVNSEPGGGATFTCYLPACEPELDVEVEQSTLEPGPGGGQTLLVVDDEEGVRELARELLEEFGYRVIEARDGETALDLHAKHGGAIDLVLLDLSMPGIGGAETMRRLRARELELPIVLWSGYSAESALPAALAAQANGFLEKPFALPALLASIEEALG